MNYLKRFFVVVFTVPVLVVLLRKWQLRWSRIEFRPEYFGEGAVALDDKAIHRFHVSVSEDCLEELRDRLRKAIFPLVLEDDTNSRYGVHLKLLKLTRDFWLYEYEWRPEERMLNSFQQWRTQIEGVHIHFIHMKPPDNKYNAIYPLLLIHGWPGSLADFRKAIPMLIDPEAYNLSVGNLTAFEVIAPSLPGFGWSDAPKKQHFGAVAAARIIAKLMTRLGITKFFCHGNNWGFLVATALGQLYQDQIFALHLNTPFAMPFLYPSLWPEMASTVIGSVLNIFLPNTFVMPEKMNTLIMEAGFFNMQSTKPDTLGTLLTDSPIGLAAYILEKYSIWTNYRHCNLSNEILAYHANMTDLITQIMIHWITGSLPSSMRIFKEFFSHREDIVSMGLPVNVPTAVVFFPDDPFYTPLHFLRPKYVNLVWGTAMPMEGQSLILEHAKDVVEDIFKLVFNI